MEGVNVEFIRPVDLDMLVYHGVDRFENRRNEGVKIIIWDKSPMLSHFQHYRLHLALLQKQMMEWKPKTAVDLLNPGYSDRFIWWTTMFLTTIALLNLASVVTSIIQTVVSLQASNK